MNFFKTIQNSIYLPDFYSALSKKSLKKSLGYFLLLILSLTIIRLITLIGPLLIEAPASLKSFTQNIIDCYPKDLEIKITNGQTFTNASEPYFLPPCGSFGKNLLVIDTKTLFSPVQFSTFKTQAWITKDAVVFKESDLETRTYSFNQIKDFKLNKQVLISFQEKLFPYLKFVGPILLLLSFIGIFLIYLFRLLHLLLLASLIWLLGKLFKYSLTYGQSYKLGLHAITLGLIVELLISLTAKFTHFSGFPFMVSVLTLGVVMINLFLPKRTA